LDILLTILEPILVVPAVALKRALERCPLGSSPIGDAVRQQMLWRSASLPSRYLAAGGVTCMCREPRVGAGGARLCTRSLPLQSRLMHLSHSGVMATLQIGVVLCSYAA
jgi:hypothetical protein